MVDYSEEDIAIMSTSLGRYSNLARGFPTAHLCTLEAPVMSAGSGTPVLTPIGHMALISKRIIINLCILDTFPHPAPYCLHPIIPKFNWLNKSLLCCNNIGLELNKRTRILNPEVI